MQDLLVARTADRQTPLRTTFAHAVREAFEGEMFAVDRELRYVLFNQAHARCVRATSGVDPKEGDSMLDLIPDLSNRGLLFAEFQSALHGERRSTLSWWTCGGKAGRLVECDFVPVTGDDGVIGVVVAMREPPHLERQEAAFAALERRYDAVLQASPDGLVLLRPNGTILEFNNAFCTLLAARPEQVVGSCWDRWIAGSDHLATLELLASCQDHARMRELIVQRADGTLLAAEVTLSPIQIDGSAAVLCIARDLTARRKAEAETTENAARLRAVFEHAPIGMGIADLVTREVVQANPKLLELIGRNGEAMEGQKMTPLSHPDDMEVEDRLRSELASGARTHYRLEKRYVHPDGTVVPVEVRVVRLPDVLGRHPLALGLMKDLRERQAVESALRASEERYRRLAENAQDMIYRFRVLPTPSIEYINKAVERLTGYTVDECLADPELVWRIIAPEDTVTLQAILEGRLSIDRPVVLRWTTRKGDLRWFEHRSTAVRDDDGRLIAIEGIAQDITESVTREQRLRLLSRALEQTGDVAIITDAEGNIIEVNRAFENVTGYAKKEVLGRNPRFLKSGEQSPDFYDRMWKELRAGRVFTSLVVNTRKDGGRYEAEMSISPIRDLGGAITHYVGLQRDVTKERQRAAQLRQAQKMEAMGQVTGGIAHDFNNLLTVILASAELLAPDLAPGSDAARLLRDLTESARHGGRMVRQLLAFGRREALSPASLDLASTVEDFLVVLRRILPASIAIGPTEGGAAPILADRAAVEQMLLNLATNARDAMPDGGELSFTLSHREVAEGFDDRFPASRYSTITVTDSGCGMDETTRRQALEPFFTTKAVGKGSGLGLSMVHGLMQQHRGWIEIVSEPGVGTSITLGFPEATSSAALAPVATVTAGALPKASTILLVEDSDALRRVATRTLELLGYKVITATDGQAGLEAWDAGRGSIDLVLTDAVMPKMGGVELIRRIRADGDRVPVVLMSGYNPADFSDLKGQVGILAKPWTMDALVDSLGEAWTGRAA